MVMTPWGDSATLRERRLQPMPGSDRAQVERKQRERLYAATVACVAAKGYARTTVADLVDLSGVSSRSFYDYFDDKAACVAETVRELTSILTPDLGTPPDGLEAEAQAIFEALARQVIAQPAASKVCLSDAFAAGPAAFAPVLNAIALFESKMKERLEFSPERQGMPDQLISARLGGILEVVRARLRTGSQGEVPELVGDLVGFLLSDRPPHQPLRLGARPGKVPPEVLDAPDHRERVIRAFSTVVAERGYQETSVTHVVRRAGMSTRTFYEHFSGKEEVAAAAIDSLCTQVVAAVTAAFARHEHWPDALRAGVSAGLNLMASRPALAHFTVVGVYAAGDFAIERRNQGLTPLRILLENNTTAWPSTRPVVYEALAGGIGWLLFVEVTKRGVEALFSLAPICTYLLLSPFIGAEKAANVASNADRNREVSSEKRYWDSALGIGAVPLDTAIGLSTFRTLHLITRQSASASELAGEVGEDVEVIRQTLEELAAMGAIEARPPKTSGSEPRFRQRFAVHRLNLFSNPQAARLSLEQREKITSLIWGMMTNDVESSIASHLFDAKVERILTRTPLHLDSEGWRELTDLHETLVRAGLAIQGRSSERMRASGETGFHVSSHQLAFEISRDAYRSRGRNEADDEGGLDGDEP
jgi:AcrR family transcriptional regulator